MPGKVQKADAARYQEYFKMECMERKLQKKILKDPGPRPAVPEQILHPVLSVKHYMERCETCDPRKVQGCGRGGSCLIEGHLSAARLLLGLLMAQPEKLMEATAVFLATVQASGGGPTDWLAKQEDRVGKLKERIERKQRELVRLADEQRKEDESQERAKKDELARLGKLNRRSGGTGRGMNRGEGGKLARENLGAIAD